MAELKKCPFCGGEAELWEYRLNGSTFFVVSCENDNCNIAVETIPRVGNTATQAIEAWNRRVEDGNVR